MFKKYLFTFLFFIFLLIPGLSQAQSQKVDIYFFYSKTCSHCAKEELFLDKLENEYPNSLKIHRHEVSEKASRELLNSLTDGLGVQVRGVPFTIVGEQYFEGYYNEEISGEQIKLAALALIRPVEITPPSFVPPSEEVMQDNKDSESDNFVPVNTEENISEQHDKQRPNNLPDFFGIELKDAALPLITIALGVLDGFNPCAMWALLFLISLLLGMKDRKRMWILGTTFIATSALVYFVFMVAWLNLIQFIDYAVWFRILIALVAIGGGVYNVRNFFVNKSGACKVSGGEKKKKVFEKLKEITRRQQFFYAMAGIMILAVAVNMVELLCSAGLPVVYGQVLVINNLATWQYYAYISLYILFFMLDDLFVFFVAMTTLHMTGLSTKYARFSNIIGGILMFLIGLALIFKPELLMFA